MSDISRTGPRLRKPSPNCRSNQRLRPTRLDGTSFSRPSFRFTEGGLGLPSRIRILENSHRPLEMAGLDHDDGRRPLDILRFPRSPISTTSPSPLRWLLATATRFDARRCPTCSFVFGSFVSDDRDFPISRLASKGRQRNSEWGMFAILRFPRSPISSTSPSPSRWLLATVTRFDARLWIFRVQ